MTLHTIAYKVNVFILGLEATKDTGFRKRFIDPFTMSCIGGGERERIHEWAIAEELCPGIYAATLYSYDYMSTYLYTFEVYEQDPEPIGVAFVLLDNEVLMADVFDQDAEPIMGVRPMSLPVELA